MYSTSGVYVKRSRNKVWNVGNQSNSQSFSKHHTRESVSGRFDSHSCSTKLKVFSYSVYNYKHSKHFDNNYLEFVRIVSEDRKWSAVALQTVIKAIFVWYCMFYRSQSIRLHFSVHHGSCLDRVWQFWTKKYTELPSGRYLKKPVFQ